MRVKAGKKTAPGWHAHRILAESMAEGHSILSGHLIQVGGNGRRISQVCQGIGSHLVWVKNNNVRFFLIYWSGLHKYALSFL
jgi:hypothetical protein